MKQLKLGFITEHGGTENHSQMMYGVFEAAKKYNANVIRFATKAYYEDSEKFHLELNKLYKIIKPQKLDGLLFLGWMPGLVGKYLNDFLMRFSSIPLVSLGTYYENIPNVCANNTKCISEILEHMILFHGYKRIVFVSPWNSDGRAIVYSEVMQKHGLYQNDLIISIDDLSGIREEERMRKVLSILIEDRKIEFDAILVMFDADARNLVKESKLRGINIPTDLAIACCEDTEYSNYSMPPLTTITFPWREVGYNGCEKLIKLINNIPIEHSTSIPGKLIIRNSCGCISNSIKLSKIEDRRQINYLNIDYKHILSFSTEVREAFSYTQIMIDDLLSALIKDLEDKTTTCFLTEFENQLQRIVTEYPYLEFLNEIEDLIYYLRNMIVAYIANEITTLILFEDIMHKVEVIIREKSITIIGFSQIQKKEINEQLQFISQKLIDTFNQKDLLSFLENNLHKLGIPSCYIFLFNNNSFEECTLIFKFVNYRRVIIDSTYVTTEYVSENIIEKHKNLLCQLLNVNNNYLGFIVFEPSLMDERIYHSLSLHISSALNAQKGAILMDNLTEEIALSKEKEKKLLYIANYDSLTGLLNRRAFYETINYIIDNSVDYFECDKQIQKFYLLFIDIDKFKQVNDSLGHNIGDLLLIEISNRLKEYLSNTSYLIPEVLQNNNEIALKETIFRLGGDEFTAIVTGISEEEVSILLDKLINSIRKPYNIEGYELDISCSIGISIYPDHADNAEVLIRYADIAMYNAKNQNSLYCFYDNSYNYHSPCTLPFL